MVQVTFRLLKPNDIISDLVSLRTAEPWSHAVVIFGDVVYSSTFPKTVKTTITDTNVACPPRSGEDFTLDLTQEQHDKMLAWCSKQVGRSYDYLSVLGWLIGTKELQTPHHTYCFEFCWDALLHAGLDTRNHNLISGKDLKALLLTLGASSKIV
jgi:uncharacterized protein YycO